MPQEKLGDKSRAPRRGLECPIGMDCPWDIPLDIPARKRWLWAWHVFWYALTKQLPDYPVVLKAALTTEDYRTIDEEALSPRARDILEVMRGYQEELELFRRGGAGHSPR